MPASPTLYQHARTAKQFCDQCECIPLCATPTPENAKICNNACQLRCCTHTSTGSAGDAGDTETSSATVTTPLSSSTMPITETSVAGLPSSTIASVQTPPTGPIPMSSRLPSSSAEGTPTTAVSPSPSSNGAETGGSPSSSAESSRSPAISSSILETPSSSQVLSSIIPNPIISATISTSDASQPAAIASPIASSTIPASPQNALAKHNNHGGAIAGGVIGGLALIVLIILGWLFYRKRQRRNHVAPSAEFMHHNRLQPSLSRQGGGLGGMGSGSGGALVQGPYTDLEDHQPPPPFTQGNFNDPIYEKLSAAAAQRQMYTASPFRDRDQAYASGAPSVRNSTSYAL